MALAPLGPQRGTKTKTFKAKHNCVKRRPQQPKAAAAASKTAEWQHTAQSRSSGG